MPFDASLTVDVEPDCPPFLSSHRGITHGIPALLEFLEGAQVPATFFVTGAVAKRFPQTVEHITQAGHELGGHGYHHRRFSQMDRNEAAAELSKTWSELSGFGPITAFRAPYLEMPPAYLPLVLQAGFHLDSSSARYKRKTERLAQTRGLRRVPVSVTSSVLRLPRPLRSWWLKRLPAPLVLFVHPWEFVDLRSEKIRLDCRFNTGAPALTALAENVAWLRRRGARFCRLRDLPVPSTERL